MAFWFLIFAALCFVWLTFDAWSLGVAAKDTPYALTAKVMGEEVNGVPLHVQNQRKEWDLRFGIGDRSQIFWLWLILALASAIGAVTRLFA